jgi:hypothetical protein
MCASNVGPSIRKIYPYLIEKYSSVTIEIEDNIKLSATIWMPQSFIILFKIFLFKFCLKIKMKKSEKMKNLEVYWNIYHIENLIGR